MSVIPMMTRLPTMKMTAARRIFERSSGGCSWGIVDSAPSFVADGEKPQVLRL
jgi:hypothetical protein